MHICNLSFHTGIVPEQIKIARVVPIYKHGDPSQFNNYRPISVLNVFSKVNERLFYNCLLKYLNRHKILYELQFGFRGKTFNRTCTYLHNWENNICNWKEWIHYSSISRFVQSFRYVKSSDIIEEIRALWYKGCSTKMVIWLSLVDNSI